MEEVSRAGCTEASQAKNLEGEKIKNETEIKLEREREGFIYAKHYAN